MRRALLRLSALVRAGWLCLLAGILLAGSVSVAAAAPAKGRRPAPAASKAKPKAKAPATRTTPVVTIPGETNPEDEADLLERSSMFWLNSGTTQGVGPVSCWILSWAAKEQELLKKAQVARQQGRAGEADSYTRQARLARNMWVHPVLPAPPPSAGGGSSGEGAEISGSGSGGGYSPYPPGFGPGSSSGSGSSSQ